MIVLWFKYTIIKSSVFFGKSLSLSSSALLPDNLSSQQDPILKLKHYSKSEFDASSEALIRFVTNYAPGDTILIPIQHHQVIIIINKSSTGRRIMSTGLGIESGTILQYSKSKFNVVAIRFWFKYTIIKSSICFSSTWQPIKSC